MCWLRAALWPRAAIAQGSTGCLRMFVASSGELGGARRNVTALHDMSEKVRVSVWTFPVTNRQLFSYSFVRKLVLVWIPNFDFGA